MIFTGSEPEDVAVPRRAVGYTQDGVGSRRVCARNAFLGDRRRTRRDEVAALARKRLVSWSEAADSPPLRSPVPNERNHRIPALTWSQDFAAKRFAPSLTAQTTGGSVRPLLKSTLRMTQTELRYVCGAIIGTACSAFYMALPRFTTCYRSKRNKQNAVADLVLAAPQIDHGTPLSTLTTSSPQPSTAQKPSLKGSWCLCRAPRSPSPTFKHLFAPE